MKKLTTADWWIALGGVALIISLIIGNQRYDLNGLLNSGSAGEFLFWFILALIYYAFIGFKLIDIQKRRND